MYNDSENRQGAEQHGPRGGAQRPALARADVRLARRAENHNMNCCSIANVILR